MSESTPPPLKRRRMDIPSIFRPAPGSQTPLPTGKAQRTSLQTLPNELIQAVASYLTTPDLCRFRLTCRQFERALFGGFASEFFTIRQVMFTEFSLRALLSISKHPHLRTKVKKVVFGDDMVAVLSCRASQPGHIASAAALMNQDWLIDSAEAVLLLSEAFAGLDNCETIGFRDYRSSRRPRDGTQWRSYGVHTAQEQLLNLHVLPNSRGHLTGRADPTSQKFAAVMRAMVCSGLKPKAIEAIYRYPDSSLRPRAFYFSPERGDEYGAALENVNTLLLSLHDHHTEAMFADRDNYWNPLIEFVGRIAYLKHLRLNFDLFHEDLSSYVLNGLCPSLGWKQLSTLELGKVLLKATQFKQILKHFNGCLKKLGLYKITIKFNTDLDWKAIFNSIKALSKLQSLHLSHLVSIYESDGNLEEMHFKETPECETPESFDAQTKLPSCISFPSSKDTPPGPIQHFLAHLAERIVPVSLDRRLRNAMHFGTFPLATNPFLDIDDPFGDSEDEQDDGDGSLPYQNHIPHPDFIFDMEQVQQVFDQQIFDHTDGFLVPSVPLGQNGEGLGLGENVFDLEE